MRTVAATVFVVNLTAVAIALAARPAPPPDPAYIQIGVQAAQGRAAMLAALCLRDDDVEPDIDVMMLCARVGLIRIP